MDDRYCMWLSSGTTNRQAIIHYGPETLGLNLSQVETHSMYTALCLLKIIMCLIIHVKNTSGVLCWVSIKWKKVNKVLSPTQLS